MARRTQKTLSEFIVLIAALSLSLLQVQSNHEYQHRHAEMSEEKYSGVTWCGSPGATKSQGRRSLVDPAFEVQLQMLAGTR